MKRASSTTKGSAAVTASDPIAAMADAMQQLCAVNADVQPLIPALCHRLFAAERAELWLSDAPGTFRLAQEAGLSGEPLGTRLSSFPSRENAALVSVSAEAQEFGARTGLTHLTALPLTAGGRHLGGCACYSSGEVPAERLRWWNLFADVATVVLGNSLSAQSNEQTITKLSLLFEATRLLNSTLDLGELLELILKIARTEVKADRGTVFMVDRNARELWSIVASGLDHQEIRIPFGHGVAGRVAETGNVVNVTNAYTLDYFDPSFDRRFNYRTQALLCMPIRHRSGEIVGVIQLLNRVSGDQFTDADVDFLSKLSAHIAMALENARLHREMLEKQRLERDLALARNIQRGLLPEAPPVVPGFEIAVANQMCYDVGGDYYDFLNLGPHTLLLVIADVEGKGVASALVMSNLQATLRALVMHLHSLEVLALSVNDMICADTRRQKFMSMFLGLVDTRGNKLHYVLINEVCTYSTWIELVNA